MPSECRFRYALYRSYVLFGRWPIEPISHPIRAWFPLGKAQRIEEVTYESPALPLSYSANAVKLTEGDPERQPPARERIPFEQHMFVGAGPGRPSMTTAWCRSGGCLG